MFSIHERLMDIVMVLQVNTGKPSLISWSQTAQDVSVTPCNPDIMTALRVPATSSFVIQSGGGSRVTLHKRITGLGKYTPLRSPLCVGVRLLAGP